jgi:hypothetical protein
MMQPWFNLKIFLIEDTDTNREEKKKKVGVCGSTTIIVGV